MRRSAGYRMLLHAMALATVSYVSPVCLAADGISVRDVIERPAEAWTRFLADPSYARAYDAYDVLSDVGYSLSDVDSERCTEHRRALDAAVLQAPVSIAVHRARMLCAEALDDEAVAEESLEAIAALSRLALVDGREQLWPKPIRVVGPADIYALLATSGLEFRYEYHPDIDVLRYFPLSVAAWDEELGKERHLSFDYIDVVYALVRDDPWSGYPVQRQLLAESFIEFQVKGGQSQALDWQAVSEARALADPVQKIEKLRPAAEAGGAQSLAAWLLICAMERIDGCADGLIDVLLPRAEQGHALYTTLLALAYATGVGVEQDSAAAATLLDAADRRWHGDGGTLMLAATWAFLRDRPEPPFLRQRLTDAAKRGSNAAGAITAALKLARDGQQLDEADIRALSHAANNGTGRGYALLMSYYHDQDQPMASNGWLKFASDAGDAASQVATGMAIHGSAASEAQRAEALALIASGAQGGNGHGMRFLAHESKRRGDWVAAQGWLLGAVRNGQIDAILDMADLYEWDRPGVQGTPQQAVEIYESLAEENDVAQARRRLADMALQGRGMEKNPAKAERWLLHDAEKGDAESAARLGYAYLVGEFGARDVDAGERWMQKAIDSGYVEAYIDYGGWYFYGNGNSLESRRRGIDLWIKGAEAGATWARNNLAWAWCTAPEPEIFDAARGVEEAGKIMQGREVPVGMLDTVAACHAAAGDYAKAVELQGDVIARLTSHEIEEDRKRENGFAGRLALYRAGKRHVELHRDAVEGD